MLTESRLASNTRPIEVGYAGRRAPTARETDMIRFVGTRATYTISMPSSTVIEQDSCTVATTSSMVACATSGNRIVERNVNPKSSTRGVSRKWPSSAETYPSSLNVSKNLRDAARDRPVRSATSVIVNASARPEKDLMTEKPRLIDCTYSRRADGSEAFKELTDVESLSTV